MRNKVRFIEVQVGQKFVTEHGYTFVKTSYAETCGRLLSRCRPNCVNLSNGHKCVIGDKVLVEILDDREG